VGRGHPLPTLYPIGASGASNFASLALPPPSQNPKYATACYCRPDAKLVELKSWGRLKVPSLAVMLSGTVCSEPCSKAMCRHIH